MVARTKKPAAAPPVRAQPEERRAAGQDRASAGAPGSEPEVKRLRRAPRVAAAASPARDAGFLTINCEPYATLYVDGKKHGFTPIVRLTLPEGAHRLRLVSSVRAHAEKKMRVRIVSGQELRKFVKW